MPLSSIDYNGQPAGYVLDPGEVVNYVENHDNQTLFDINAYRFERRGSTGPKYELPGLWLDSGEAYALLSSQPVAIKQRVRAAGAAGCTTKVTPQGAAVG